MWEDVEVGGKHYLASTIEFKDKTYYLTMILGIVASFDKREVTEIRGDRDNTYSETTVHDDVILKDHHGFDRALRLRDWDFVCRVGQELQAIWVDKNPVTEQPSMDTLDFIFNEALGDLTRSPSGIRGFPFSNLYFVAFVGILVALPVGIVITAISPDELCGVGLASGIVTAVLLIRPRLAVVTAFESAMLSLLLQGTKAGQIPGDQIASVTASHSSAANEGIKTIDQRPPLTNATLDALASLLDAEGSVHRKAQIELLDAAIGWRTVANHATGPSDMSGPPLSIAALDAFRVLLDTGGELPPEAQKELLETADFWRKAAEPEDKSDTNFAFDPDGEIGDR